MQEKNGRFNGLHFVIFLLEREYLLSRISVNSTVGFLRIKKQVVLHEEGNAWTPVLRSFDKLYEVEVLSYLFYTLFKCFVMFKLIEAVRGRLIGSKSWNQSVEIFGIFLVSPDQFRD